VAGYQSVDSHRSMLFDEVRNRAYGEAIAAAVTPDSVVLDLGCGLGIHGLLAARAGARKVYMVEPEPIIELTRRVVADNGFANVELIQARAEELVLEEPVDVIVSVFTGNFLLTEDLLPSLFAARDRCLRDGGVLLPGRARMRVAPVCCEQYFDTVVGRWGQAIPDAAIWSAQAFDYSAVRPYAANTTYYDSAKNFEATLLAPPATLQELDFYTATAAEVNAELTVTVAGAGVCHGWLGWFDMDLGLQSLSTSPLSPPLHWGQVYMPLPEPATLRPGQEIGFSLQRATRGDWNWTSDIGGQRFRGSTFLDRPLDLGLLKRLGEGHKPQINQPGAAARLVLSLMDGKHSNADIARRLELQWPQRFDASSALELVQALVRKYG
jgi:SAM-dependent methyltransferase